MLEFPANLDNSMERLNVLAVGAGEGCLDFFSMLYHSYFRKMAQ